MLLSKAIDIYTVTNSHKQCEIFFRFRGISTLAKKHSSLPRLSHTIFIPRPGEAIPIYCPRYLKKKVGNKSVFYDPIYYPVLALSACNPIDIDRVHKKLDVCLGTLNTLGETFMDDVLRVLRSVNLYNYSFEFSPIPWFCDHYPNLYTEVEIMTFQKQVYIDPIQFVGLWIDRNMSFFSISKYKFAVFPDLETNPIGLSLGSILNHSERDYSSYFSKTYCV